jgi:hypothetical protein
MKISEFIAHLRKGNPLLYYAGLVNLILFICCLTLFFLDDRQLMGINVWIKPMKFTLSVSIYLWTFAWLLQYLTDKRKVRFISIGIFLTMAVEIFLILTQATRGVQSHFNVHTALDGMIFATMGILIAINSLLNLYVLILFFTKEVSLEPTTLMAWRMGLFFLFLAGISGALMSQHLAHTYGAPDGGDGLPFLNWSTTAGDMRVAHFITMHGLQFFPLLAWFIRDRVANVVIVIQIVFVVYLAVSLLLHNMALQGIPLFG